MRKKGSKNLKRCIGCNKTVEELDGLEYIGWKEIGDLKDWFSAFGCWCSKIRR